MSANEIGVATESIKQSAAYTTDVDIAGYDGKLIGNCLGGEYIDVSFSGKLLKSTAFSSIIGVVLVLENQLVDRIGGSVTSGTLVIKKIDDEKDNQGNNSIDVSGKYYPDIASA